ncbi:MAG: MotA/TolQ/ExbB proton channel family protein [Oligoflexus sp.]
MESRKISRSGILQIVASLMILFVVGAWYFDFLFRFLIGTDATIVGRVINLILLFIFALGTLRILTVLWQFSQEENELERFSKNVGSKSTNVFHDVSHDSIIGRRYHILLGLKEKNADINQAVLSGVLKSELNAHSSLARYFNSILILLGMLGTILSLGIALVGASNLFESISNVEDMSVIVNGMSTALSTTLTAIVCYVFFRFFLSKLYESQNFILRSVERLTMTYLLPELAPRIPTVDEKLAGLLRRMDELMVQINRQQEQLDEREDRLTQGVEQYRDGMGEMIASMSKIHDSLKQGFRL